MSRLVFCYPIENNKELERYKNYKEISPDKENIQRCCHRERWKEIKYFRKSNSVIFWNKKKRIFTDIYFQEIKLKILETIFPRVSTYEFGAVVYDIIKKGWAPLVNPYEDLAIEHWPKMVPEDLHKRKLIIATKNIDASQFENCYNQVKDEDERFFIKSLKKHWSFNGTNQEWFRSGAAMSMSIGSGSDLVLFSEYLDIKKDDHGTLEYRCFIINGRLCSISRYMDYENIEIPRKIFSYAIHLISLLVGNFVPENVVIDIAELENGELVMIEMNEPCCSGRYINNTVESFMDVLNV